MAHRVVRACDPAFAALPCYPGDAPLHPCTHAHVMASTTPEGARIWCGVLPCALSRPGHAADVYAHAHTHTHTPECGAVVIFAGITRSHTSTLSHGHAVHGPCPSRSVSALEFEAAGPVACVDVHTLAHDAVQRYRLRAMYVAHVGTCVCECGCDGGCEGAQHGVCGAATQRVSVPVGEASVVVAAASPHRADAMEAVRVVMDELKARMRVWKREVFTDGTAEWKENCA